MLFLGGPVEETPGGNEDRSSECPLGRGPAGAKALRCFWRSSKEYMAEAAKGSGKKRGRRES